MNNTKILVTGGHMTPAFAVIEELNSRGQFDYLWVGHKYNQFGNKNTSAEFQAVHNLGIKFTNLSAGKLTRNWGGGNWIAGITNIFKIPYGFLRAFTILVGFRPKLVISFGGYLALPVVIIANTLGIKVVTHEQTAVTGLTNKILPKYSDHIYISWPSSAKYYPQEKTYLTGNPIRQEIYRNTTNQFNVNSQLPTIYVTGGNQGSHVVNSAIFKILPNLLHKANVIHQTGNSTVTKDFAIGKVFMNHEAKKYPGRYFVETFIYGDLIGEVLSKSSLVIGRSGANTVYEILAIGKPAIFIPIPWVTHNEQYINAKLAADTGIATVLQEKELTADSLLSEIEGWLNSLTESKVVTGAALEQAQRQSKAVIKPDAATQIVDKLWPFIS